MWTIVSRHAQYHLAKEKVVGAHRKVCDHFGGQAVDTPTIVFGQVVNRPPQTVEGGETIYRSSFDTP